jgi:long-chain acyl-CoA synthetase
MSISNVPLYDTLGEETICWTFEQTKLSTIFLSNEGISKLMEIKKAGKIDSLTTLVTFDEIKSKDKELAKEGGVKLIHYEDVVKAGKESSMEFKPCCGDSILTICYTSGTTGKAKGVVLTQKNFRDNAVASMRSGIFHEYDMGYSFLSYLPLAHVFERIVLCNTIIAAMKVGFYHGVVPELKDDMQALHPDIFTGVPRVFCCFYEKIMETINNLGIVKRTLVNTAISNKVSNYKKDSTLTHWLYDKVILSKIRDSFGGNIKMFVSGAAPMDPNMMEKLRVMCSCRFIQGYGQTETAGPVCVTYDSDNYPGSSGPPMACCMAKVVDVPEMGYLSTDETDGILTPRGELCFQGSNLTKEYFKNSELTEKLYDKEGWMHTGDIGMINASGCIVVIDRIKNMLKLQQGEYVALEKLENDLVNSNWVFQLFAYGDSYQTYLVGIIVPDKDTVMKWAKENNVKGSFEEVCKNEELNEVILKDLDKLAREKKVSVLL